jgi:hypothetical protein
VQTVTDLLGWWDKSQLPFGVSGVANPCGLIAKYMFTDEFISISEVNGKQ